MRNMTDDSLDYIFNNYPLISSRTRPMWVHYVYIDCIHYIAHIHLQLSCGTRKYILQVPNCQINHPNYTAQWQATSDKPVI